MRVNAATRVNDPLSDPYSQTGRTGDESEIGPLELVKTLAASLLSLRKHRR